MQNRTSTGAGESFSPGASSRVLSPTAWALFETLYAGRGDPLSGDFLRKAIGASALGDHVHKLRRALVGSRYRVETRRGTRTS
jgi:hypothetical protein